MAKDKTEAEIAAKKEKKEKKEKKRKREEEVEDVTTSNKEKKSKKRKSEGPAVDNNTVMDVDGQSPSKVGDADEKKNSKAVIAVPLSALVPFANPLADEKSQKKVLKAVKKAAKHKSLKRGVKECVKSIRKSPTSAPNTATPPPGIVILAADISPMDVISHIPVLCEDHNIPYVYVPSRAELGAAGSTKRPTSVVMLTPSQGKKAKEEDAQEWDEAYKELYKLAVKLGQTVKV